MSAKNQLTHKAKKGNIMDDLSALVPTQQLSAIDLEFDNIDKSQLAKTNDIDPFQIDIDDIPESQNNNENDDELSSLVSYIDKSAKEQVSQHRSMASMQYDLLNKKRPELYDNCNFVAFFDQTCPGSICIDSEALGCLEGTEFKENRTIDWSIVNSGRFRGLKSQFARNEHYFRNNL